MKTIRLFLICLLGTFASLQSWAQIFTVNGIRYNKLGNGVEVFTPPNGGSYSGSVVIPAEVEYDGSTYSVLSICDVAFSNQEITRIKLPDGLKTIGISAFANCANLDSVVIPESVTKIGDYAFHKCTSLTKIAIPDKIEVIQESTFKDCTALETVRLGKSVKKINHEAFIGCSNLVTINIPDGVTSIGVSAFYQCYNLAAITMPNSVTTVGAWAFYYCSKLISVTLSNSLTSIGEQTFMGCHSLVSLTIPNSVTSIAYRAFGGSYALKEVKVEWKDPSLINYEDGVFVSISTSNCTLYVPAGSEALYKEHEVWKDFKIVSYTPTGITTTTQTNARATINNNTICITSPTSEKVYIYTLDGRLLSTAQKAEGEAFFPIAKQSGKVLIVKGESGWSQKVAVR